MKFFSFSIIMFVQNLVSDNVCKETVINLEVLRSAGAEWDGGGARGDSQHLLGAGVDHVDLELVGLNMARLRSFFFLQCITYSVPTIVFRFLMPLNLLIESRAIVCMYKVLYTCLLDRKTMRTTVCAWINLKNVRPFWYVLCIGSVWLKLTRQLFQS